ncbi:MAG: hypothetical protein U0Q16_11165 [Bryobacteraceae bacterium]
MRFTVFFLAVPVLAQMQVTEVAVRAETEPIRVRPFESIPLQVRAYGSISSQNGSQRVRLQRGNAKMRVVDSQGGWVSKAFRYQGKDDEAFYRETASTFGDIFGALTKDYVLQDAFLYVAPEKPGRYQVEATLEGKVATVSVEVDSQAPSRKPQETNTFGPPPRVPDPYRKIAEFWAPFLAQETWFTPKADIPSRFDYDGDWQGDNNWDDLDGGSSQAYVHYAAVETATHWFLIYNVFHPRDYSDKCVAGSCHENDNEGLILTIRKDGSEFGKLEVLETLAHNNLYSYVADNRIRKGAHNVEGPIELYQGSHPAVFIESGGHGIYGAKSGHSRYELASDKFTAGIGMTFIYKGIAERPKHYNDRLVGYELLPIQTEWWAKAVEGTWNQRTFDEYYAYQPFGNRPAGTSRRIGGTFYGRKQSANKAKPFWGWHDNETKNKKILNVGQWGLDPAYGVQRNLTFPNGEAPATDYTFNPYLGVE